MKKKIIIGITTATIILCVLVSIVVWKSFSSDTATDPNSLTRQYTAAECAAAGGDSYGNPNFSGQSVCVLPTSDSDKTCTDGSQCEAGTCIAISSDATTGTCQENNDPYYFLNSRKKGKYELNDGKAYDMSNFTD